LEVIARIDMFGVETLESLNPRILDPFFPSSREKNHSRDETTGEGKAIIRLLHAYKNSHPNDDLNEKLFCR
jgi:hypothetical protein